VPNKSNRKSKSINWTRVSIVTASYGDLSGLKATGTSILGQSYPVEWIVVDSDSGVEFRKYLSSVELGIHSSIWKSEKDLGLYDGMNKGFNLSSGEVILFLNCGDTLSHSDSIQRVIDSYHSSSWNWAVGLAVRLNEHGEPRAVWEYLQPQLSGLALGTRTFCHQATFYTRGLLEKVMPYKIDNLAADHLLNVKAFRISTPEMLPIVTTLFQDGGISSQRPFSAAMRDLRAIRIEQDLLLGKSKAIDWILSWVVVSLVNAGGVIWSGMRLISRKLVHPDERLELFSKNLNSK
jgi:glycosyltransferase involved in cell wall biosynthesis